MPKVKQVIIHPFISLGQGHSMGYQTVCREQVGEGVSERERERRGSVCERERERGGAVCVRVRSIRVRGLADSERERQRETEEEAEREREKERERGKEGEGVEGQCVRGGGQRWEGRPSQPE
jgi:hypothetical protein